MSEDQQKEKLQTEMPSMEGEFDVEVIGELTKKKFLGSFTSRILNRKNRAAVGKHRAYLNGADPQGLSIDILALHHKIAYLKLALTDAPKFWKGSDGGYELFDGNVIDEVYVQVLAFEKQWMTEVWGSEAVAEMEKK